MKIAAVSSCLLLMAASPGWAQDKPAGHAEENPATAEALLASAKSNAEKAVTAIEAGDYEMATALLRGASNSANRLSLQSVTKRLDQKAPSFSLSETQFALARSSTLSLEALLNRPAAFEQTFASNQGDLLTVRVFGNDADLADFNAIAADTTMIEKEGLELATMRGETAIKKRGDDGALSVLMMSEADHALIEVEGDSADAVMAFIGELEAEAE